MCSSKLSGFQHCGWAGRLSQGPCNILASRAGEIRIKKTLILTALFAFACGGSEDAQTDDTGSQASADASPSGWVEITYGERTLHAYVAQPEGEGPHPAMIVIHQNRGSSDWVRTVADPIA